MSDNPKLVGIANEFAASKKLIDISFVGSGAYKETYEATQPSGQTIAVKLFDPLKCNPSREVREISAMKMCDTSLISKLYDYGDFCCSKGCSYRFTIEEFIDGGNLSKQIEGKTLSPRDIANIAINLVKAIDHLRKLNLVHRDIKPDNIMFRKGSSDPVLVDFGLVRDLSESSLTMSYLPQGPGTPYYSAPEQLNNDKYLIKWRTDQFSLGIVLGICLTGEHPFAEPGMNKTDVLMRVASRKKCSSQFCDLVKREGLDGIIKMLEPWPVQRYSSPDTLITYFESKV